MPNFESQLYRDELAEKLKSEKDKEKKREILDSAKETPEYGKALETHNTSRQEMLAEKDLQKEVEHNAEKSEYLKEVEILKFKFESKVTETNRLINQFYDGFSGDINTVLSPESLASIDEQIKSLDTKIVDSHDYITRASQILLQVRRLEADIKSDVETHNATKTKIARRTEEVKSEIDALKSQGILKRIMSRSEIGERQREIKGLNKRATLEDNAIKKQKADLEKISTKKYYGLEEKMINLFNAEINKTAKADIGHALKELWDKVNDNSFFVEEMGGAYIDQFIQPAIDKIIEERRQKKRSYYYNGPVINERLKDVLCANLKKYLTTKDESLGEPIRKMVSQLPSELNHIFQPLLQNTNYGTQGPIKDITYSLFVQYAIEKTSAGTENLKNEREKLVKQDRAEGLDSYSRRQITEDYYMRFPVNFDELPYGVKWPISLGYSDRNVFPDMPVWSASKELLFVKRAFGSTVETLDNKYLNQILKESLTDREGTFIDNLYYYPNPDSIKTLVLLAAADFANYRTVHANWVLAKLSQRPDWGGLLDEAEKKYPELKQARPVLEKWKSHGVLGINTEISVYATDLATSLIEKESDNQLQSRLAEEVLPNGKLIAILENRKNVPQEETLLLKQVDALVKNNISSHGFDRLVRDSIKKVVRLSGVDEKTDEFRFLSVAKSEADNELAAVLTISKKIVETNGDSKDMDFLASSDVVEAVKSFIHKKNERGAEPSDIDAFLSAHRELPNLAKSGLLFSKFCKYFNGNKTIELYKKLYEVIWNRIDVNTNTVATVMGLAGEGKLDEDRALSLWNTIKTGRGEVSFASMDHVYQDIALSHPDIFLQTNDGLDLLAHLSKEGGIDNLPIDLESVIGSKLVGDGSEFKREVKHLIADVELKQKIQPLFIEGQLPDLDKSNWKGLMLAFIGVTEGQYGPGSFFKDYGEQIKNIFEKEGVKDICLSEMKKLWLEYLENRNVQEFPLSLTILNEYIKSAGGAGPLSQVESLSLFTEAYVTMLNNKHTVERTKQEVIGGLALAEKRFTKERWSNDDISDFYNVSRDVVNAAPSLFSEYFDLFEKLKPKEFKEFSQELFPLHRVILSLSEARDRYGNIKVNARDLVKVRRNVSEIVDETGKLKSVDEQKKELVGQILDMFRNKFGIVKIPESLTSENIRSLSDISMYMANLSGRDAQKENIIGFYLALSVNDKWEEYRRGVEINPEEYLTPEKAARLKPYLENRLKLNPVTPENLNIQAEKMPEFMKLLEEESENVAIGNVETVDIKLGSVITNLRGLEDLDLYPDALDKQRMRLLLEYGNKKIGGITAKLYQSLARNGRQFELSDEDKKILDQIEATLQGSGIELTAENLKKYFQDEIKPLAVVANILSFVDELRVEKEISELRDTLKPSNDIIAVFNKVGEEFKSTSGAVAISQDLEYLDNLIVKKTGELSEQEVNMVKSYLSKIREKLATLEDIYDLVGKKFASMKQGQAETKNELLRNKLEDISRIINRTESQQMIASVMTNNLSYIIENIRECLSCVQQGANNDTNLTFGDPNKFYLYSKSEMKAASISDELVFFEPVTFADGNQEMVFVLDRVYGTNTPAILINQIEAVYKKFAKIKREFPNAKISMFVTDSAIQTSGLSSHLLVEKLQEKFGGRVRLEQAVDAQVDVVESASGDHYVEFGGGARTSGVRVINGVVLRI